MAPAKKTARKSNSRKNGSAVRKSSNGTNGSNGNGNGKATPRPNYKAQLEALQRQIADVHLMLDAVDCPQNCGTLNGRMVEYARKQYKKYGTMTNPGGEAKRMLAAVEAPVVGDGPPWSLYSS